jgi:hypothetical protein
MSTYIQIALIVFIALFITVVLGEWIVRRRGRADRGDNSAMG